ncbi:nitroreductase family protein [Tepidibacter hydrothermalis]|uniref:Nitroreductase family protein n=1 Tax=Tepidibacter hydrothermalis TaxID=3036126 RepID=A0ABY8E7R5_9FIRM|nr:nitroreductase family protein [Tepidibacter hydrothermalis]WFD08948.1 nitroreductase family protein [Tepidibacter hydrothermalis]
MNDIIKNIKERRSIRKFKEEQIKDEELEVIIEAGMYAPSAHNEQPWHFTIIQNKDIISEINKESKMMMKNHSDKWIAKLGNNEKFDIHYNAPTVIVVSEKKDCYSKFVNASAATQNMLLAAESIGVGSCWVGFSKFCFVQEDKIKKLNIPEGYEPHYTVALGYKALDKKQSAPKRNEDVVTYIR